MGKYVLQHVRGIRKHVRVPIANDPIATRVENSGSLAVGLRIDGMLAAVQFNNQFSIRARKVRNESFNGKLSPELPAIALPIAKAVPQAHLCFGRPPSQRPGSRSFVSFGHVCSLTRSCAPTSPRGRGNRPAAMQCPLIFARRIQTGNQVSGIWRPSYALPQPCGHVPSPIGRGLG